MNRDRRKRIEEIGNRIGELQAELEGIRDEEQEAYDNLPENLQNSELAETMSEAIDNIDYAFTSLDEAAEYLHDVLGA